MERTLNWLRSAAKTVWYITVRAATSLRDSWGIVLLSVALAISLWVFVTDQKNPDATRRVLGSVTIEAFNVPSGQAVFSISPDSVTVDARAPESVFQRLTAANFRATVDLSTLSPQSTVHVQVDSLESRADVVSFSPQEITVTLENVISQTVPIVVRGHSGPPRGFRLGTIDLDIEEAVVSGPERLVLDVVEVRADILLNERVDFEQRVTLQARGEDDRVIQGVTVQPESVVAVVEIIQLEFSRTFAVRPVVSGEPADGYNVTGIVWDATTVVLTGPLDVLQNIDPVSGIETAAVPIEGATAEVINTVLLLLPEGVRADQSSVTVRVSITPAQGQFGFDVAPTVNNLASELSAVVVPSTVRVVLAGTVPDLDQISLEDIIASVNVDGLEAGDHLISVQVDPLPGITIVSITPLEITVSLSSP